MQDSPTKRPPLDRDSRPVATLTMIAPTDGSTAVFASGYPLRQASFLRREDHLLVRAAGHADVLVPRFFAGGGQTALATRDGMEMSRHMVLLMLNMSARMERVLNELTPAGQDS